MFSFNQLKGILKPYFKIDNRRLDCLTQILISLITVRTVNLVEIAQAMITGASFEARYKRVRRFFKDFNAFSFEILTKFIAKFFLPVDAKWQLSLDRTNWKWEKNINILMLSVVLGTIAIPLVWKFLPKKGNSNFEKRVGVIEEFIRNFGTDVIDELVADREFVSHEWFKWLSEKKIPFTIRIKKNALVDSSKGKKQHVRRLFINLRARQTRYLTKEKELFGLSLWLAATRSENGGMGDCSNNTYASSGFNKVQKKMGHRNAFWFFKIKGIQF